MAYPEVRILLKSAGEYEVQIIDRMTLHNLLIAKSDDEGNVEADIVIFQECFFKKQDDGSIRWVLSDYSVDRDKERMDPHGWNLKEFKKNPVVLWSHDHFRPAIGKVISPRVKGEQLIGDVVFSSAEVDAFAGMIEAKIREGIISTGSVGFKSNKIEIVDDKNEDATLIHRKQTLYEFSIVNIPANPNASAQRSAEPEAEKAEIKKSTYVETLFKDVPPETRERDKASEDNDSIEALFDGVGRETSGRDKAPGDGDSIANFFTEENTNG